MPKNRYCGRATVCQTSGPKSVAVPTVEARIVRSARVAARRGRDARGAHDAGEDMQLVRRAFEKKRGGYGAEMLLGAGY